MEQFTSLKLPILIDILADFKFHYSAMLAKGANRKEDIESWKNTIQLLQTEINYRTGKITVQ